MIKRYFSVRRPVLNEIQNTELPIPDYSTMLLLKIRLQSEIYYYMKFTFTRVVSSVSRM